MRPFFFEGVHFGEIGGEEDVGGGAFFDLAGEGAGGSEIELYFGAGGFFVGGVDFFEDVGKAGGGGDAEGLGLGGDC